MGIRYDNVDTPEILRAAIANKQILKDRPGPTGYTDGSPVKSTDTVFAGDLVGFQPQGEFRRYVDDPRNRREVDDNASRFYNSPLMYDILGAPQDDMGGIA